MNARIKEGPVARPENVGFDSARLKRVGETFAAEIESGMYDGARLLAARHGITVVDLTVGFADRAAARPLPDDAAFCLMSVSKTLTAAALLQRVERGEVSLLSTVASVIPEFAVRGKERVTLFELLTHSSGIGTGPVELPPERRGDLAASVAAICALPLESAPGEVRYSTTMGYAILGEVVRRLDGGKRAFRDIMAQDLFEPLGMKDTAVGLPERLAARRVPVVVRDTGAKDLNAAALTARDQAYTAQSEMPSSGMFTTGSDLLRFTESLRLGGALDGMRALAPATVSLMRRIYTGSLPDLGFEDAAGYPANLGLGVYVRGNGIFPSHMPSLASSETFGGRGIGSTGFWVDPHREMSFVLLTAGLIGRRANLIRFQRIGDLLMGSLVDP